MTVLESFKVTLFADDAKGRRDKSTANVANMEIDNSYYGVRSTTNYPTP